MLNMEPGCRVPDVVLDGALVARDALRSRADGALAPLMLAWAALAGSEPLASAHKIAAWV